MRRVLILSAMLLCTLPSAARAQSANTSIQGFGGLTFGTSSVLGRTSTASALGGVVAAGVTPNMQIVGEVGRLSEHQAAAPGPARFHARQSARFGVVREGGVPFIASP